MSGLCGKGCTYGMIGRGLAERLTGIDVRNGKIDLLTESLPLRERYLPMAP